MTDDGQAGGGHAAALMRCELVTWAEVDRRCCRLAGLIRDSGWHPGLVVAIGRGGYVPARLLCDHLHLTALTSIKVEHYLAGAQKQQQARIRYPLKADIRGLRVLLVDDVNDTGDTLEVALAHLHSFGPAEVRSAVMHQKITTGVGADYSATRIVKWRWLIYPWAVCEDVGGFLRGMEPPPQSLQDARRRLAQDYGIGISVPRLRMIAAGLPG